MPYTGFLIGLFLSANFAAIASLSCHSCNATSASGCSVGHCEGDYCVDSSTFRADVGGNVFQRGCYSVLAGRNYFDTVIKGAAAACIGRQTGLSVDSLCGCNDQNYCNNGSFSIDQGRPQGRPLIQCICDTPTDETICGGHACILGVKGQRGKINYRSKVFLSFQPYPRLGLGCTQDGANKNCVCNSTFCNANADTPESSKMPDGRVACNDSISGTCKGNGCGLEIIAVSGSPISTRRFCHFETASNQFDRYCDMFEFVDSQRTRCYCADDYCNSNLQKAISSIKKKTQCNLCQGSNCISDSFCLGDVCIDEYNKITTNKLQRGCYEYLAGGTSLSNVSTDCSVIQTEGSVLSSCVCDTNYCMHGPPAIGKSAKDIQCFAGASVSLQDSITVCEGETCLFGNVTGCLTYPKKYGVFSPLIPEKNSQDCFTLGNNKICSCLTPSCNLVNGNTRNLNEVQEPFRTGTEGMINVTCLLNATDSCFGNGCYYKEKDGEVTRGCIQESPSLGQLKPVATYACGRKIMENTTTIECLCPLDCCNADLQSAIDAVNGGSPTGAPVSTCFPTTTVTTTTPTTTSTTTTTTISSTTPTTSSTVTSSSSATTTITSTSTVHTTTTTTPTTTTTKTTTTIQPYGKRKCYYCRGDKTSCTGSCIGDYCVDLFQNNTMTRGCYDLLAGYPPKMFSGDQCVGNNVFGDFSLCACIDSDFCREGSFKKYNSSAGMQCNDGTGYCRGSECVYGSVSGCITTASDFRYFSYLLPHGRDACMNIDGRAICTCSKPLCNSMTRAIARIQSDSVSCRSSNSATGSCEGQACYLWISGSDAWQSKTGCVSGVEGGVLTSDLFCTSVKTPSGKTTICLCKTDFCNVAIDKAISSINAILSPTTSTMWVPKRGRTRKFSFFVFLAAALVALL